MVTLGISRGMPDSLHQRLWPFIPTQGFSETAWESCPFGAAYRVFRSTLQGLINRLSASHRYLRLLTPLVMRSLMMEVDELYARLIVLYNFVCTSWLL
jgi:hypothetical protein